MTTPKLDPEKMNLPVTLGGKIDAQLKWVLIAFASGFVLLAGLVINRTDSVREALSAKSDAISTDLRQTNERLARMEAVASEHGSAPAR